MLRSKHDNNLNHFLLVIDRRYLLMFVTKIDKKLHRHDQIVDRRRL